MKCANDCIATFPDSSPRRRVSVKGVGPCSDPRPRTVCWKQVDMYHGAHSFIEASDFFIIQILSDTLFTAVRRVGSAFA